MVSDADNLHACGVCGAGTDDCVFERDGAAVGHAECGCGFLVGLGCRFSVGDVFGGDEDRWIADADRMEATGDDFATA